MALTSTELQTLRDDAVRNKAAGIVGIHFSDGRSIQYVSSPSDWQKIITDLDSMISTDAGQTTRRFTLPVYSRD